MRFSSKIGDRYKHGRSRIQSTDLSGWWRGSTLILPPKASDVLCTILMVIAYKSKKAKQSILCAKNVFPHFVIKTYKLWAKLSYIFSKLSTFQDPHMKVKWLTYILFISTASKLLQCPLWITGRVYVNLNIRKTREVPIS